MSDDIFVIWKDNDFQGVVTGECHDLLHKMETDWSPGKGMYLDWRPDESMPLGFTLSDGRRVVRLGDYDLYLKTEKEIRDEIATYNRTNPNFKDRMLKLADKYYAATKLSNDPVWVGSNVSRMCSAFWFAKNYPVTKDQLDLRLHEIDRRHNSMQSVSDAERRALIELFMMQENEMKVQSNDR